jgi:hypothetical protein
VQIIIHKKLKKCTKPSGILSVLPYVIPKVATKRVATWDAAGNRRLQVLKMRALLAFEKTYAFFAFNLLNATWYQAFPVLCVSGNCYHETAL